MGATSAQVAAHMASKMGTWPAQSEILKAHQNAGFHWCFPSAALRLKGVKLSPQVPSCGMLELTWTSCITWLQFGTHLELWAQPIGANLGVQENATWATWAPLGEPIWRLQYDMLTTCQFYRHFHHVLPLMGARVRLAMSPTLGLSLHRTKLRMLCPTRVQTCPSYAMLDPSSAQVGPKLEPTDASSAQVRPKLGPSGLLFGPSSRTARLTPVGFGWAPFLSISKSLGAGSSRREANRIPLLRNMMHPKSPTLSPSKT